MFRWHLAALAERYRGWRLVRRVNRQRRGGATARSCWGAEVGVVRLFPTAATRWALSPTDDRAHAVVPDGATAGAMVARCGHSIPLEAGLDDGPRAQLCASCVLMVAPSFAQRGELLNAARDAEGLGEWFPDDGQ